MIVRIILSLETNVMFLTFRLKTSLLFMERLNKTERPIFYLLCVFVSNGNLL